MSRKCTDVKLCWSCIKVQRFWQPLVSVVFDRVSSILSGAPASRTLRSEEHPQPCIPVPATLLYIYRGLRAGQAPCLCFSFMLSLQHSASVVASRYALILLQRISPLQ